MPARFVNIVVGSWLFVSAFAWSHGGADFINTWICGVLTVVLAVVSLTRPGARWGLTLLSLWLVIGTLAFHWSRPATAWNNFICAAVIFVASLAPEPEDASFPLGARHSSV